MSVAGLEDVLDGGVRLDRLGGEDDDRVAVTVD
jgi:hypothetical protein